MEILREMYPTIVILVLVYVFYTAIVLSNKHRNKSKYFINDGILRQSVVMLGTWAIEEYKNVNPVLAVYKRRLWVLKDKNLIRRFGFLKLEASKLTYSDSIGLNVDIPFNAITSVELCSMYYGFTSFRTLFTLKPAILKVV